MTKLSLNIAAAFLLAAATPALAQERPQVPWGEHSAASRRDRVYVAEQFSNTVSVTNPVSGELLGVIRLGDPSPSNFSPLYKGQVLVHGIGYSPDGKTLAVVSVGSNAVTFIDTATNTVKHTTYVGRSPHEAFFTRDGSEVWVTVRGEDYVSVIDAATYQEKLRLKTPAGPGMTTFSPDGKYGYVCSSFNPELVIFDVASHTQVGSVPQPSPFCPNIAATPDGKQVWFTLKDVGKAVVFDAKPPFTTLKVIDTGPITNHVNFVSTARGVLAYVSIGGLNQVQVFRTDTFEKIATIPVGNLPHGVWPSGDGKSVFVGLENDDRLVRIDTTTNKVVGSTPTGQAPQALAYVVNAVPEGDGRQNLQPLGVAANTTALSLGAAGGKQTSVTLFDQGLIQIVQAAVTGLSPKHPYQLALSTQPDGGGTVEGLANFMTNPAGSAVVNAAGPVRQVVADGAAGGRRYLVIREGGDQPGAVVQVQQP